MFEWLFGCRHDWESLDWESPERIGKRLGTSVTLPSDDLFDWQDDRVCLKCGKRDNQIARYEAALLAELERRAKRKELAKSLTNKGNQ